MPERNTFAKIVSYLHAVARRPVSYNRQMRMPYPTLIVSPTIFRDYTCPAGCGGCCPRFSLVYLPRDFHRFSTRYPQEAHHFKQQLETVNGHHILLFVDSQTDHSNHHCRFLNSSDGRCTIHMENPFSCQFELLRFTHHKDRVLFGKRLFGRGWNMLRVDGVRGAKCDMIPYDPVATNRDIGLLKKLKTFADYAHLPTDIPAIIDYLASGPHEEPLTITRKG